LTLLKLQNSRTAQLRIISNDVIITAIAEREREREREERLNREVTG